VIVLVTASSSECGQLIRPTDTVAGSATTSWPTARATSTRPAPCSYTPAAPGSAAPTSAAFTCAPVHSGCRCARIAADPATCGVAIDVPLIVTYRSPRSPRAEYRDRAAVISTPGAVISGFNAASCTRGPRPEKLASASWSSTAPTASAASALAGEETVSAP
jgi:hypothetical protein